MTQFLAVGHEAEVSAFVNENYEGVFLTEFVHRMNHGTLLYRTHLYSIDGPCVYTYVLEDGGCVDATSYYHRGGLAYRR